MSRFWLTPAVSSHNRDGPETFTVSLTVRPAPGDVDSDNDADQGDFGHLQASLTGPAGGPAPACADADLNQDNRVDGVDLNLFLGCMNGPGEAIDPNCVP